MFSIYEDNKIKLYQSRAIFRWLTSGFDGNQEPKMQTRAILPWWQRDIAPTYRFIHLHGCHVNAIVPSLSMKAPMQA